MKNWKETTLGEISKIISGSTPSTKNPSYWDGAIPWITPKDLASFKGVYIKHGERNITEEGYNNSSTQLLPFNSIVFSSRAPIGYIAIAANEVTTNQGFKNIVCNEEKAHYKFIYYWLKNETERIKKLSSGSTFSEASATLMRSLKISLPSLPEQHAITAVLSSFDDKIELLRSQNQTLEALAQALFKEWFVDFNFPNAAGKPYKKTGGKMVQSELGAIPAGWKNDVLESFVTHIKEGINPQDTPEKIFNHYSIPAFDESKMPLLEKGKTIFSNKYIVENNSFLVSKLNPSTPRIWTIFESKNGICSTEFQVLKVKNQDYFSFIHCLLNSNYFTQELASKVQGTSGSHQRVKPEDILKVHSIIAKNNLLSSFNELVLPMLQKISKNSLQIQSLSILRDKLLPKLMTRVINLKSFI